MGLRVLVSLLGVGLLWPSSAHGSPGELGSPRLLRSLGVPLHTAAERASDIVREVRKHATIMGFAPADDSVQLMARPSRTSQGLEIWHVAGSISGIPLAEPVARVLVDTKLSTLELIVGESSLAPLNTTTPRLDEATVLAHLAASGIPGAQSATEGELVALSLGDETRLAWRIDPPLDLQHLTNPVFYIDAQTGELLRSDEQVRAAFLRSFYRNPSLDPEAGNYRAHEIEHRADTLEGPKHEVMNCITDTEAGECVPRHLAKANRDGDFIYPEPDVTDREQNRVYDEPFTEVSVYYHSDKFLEWMRSYGVSMHCNSYGKRAVSLVNFHFVDDGKRIPLDNAYYTGDCSKTMLYGQGTDVDFGYDGDVVYHELGHGVVDFLQEDFFGRGRLRADGFVVDAAAINEAVADFLSSAYARDPVVGDYIGQYWGAVSRPGVRNNSNSFQCPDSFAGEAHVDSEAFAGALWQGYRLHGDVFIGILLDSIALLPGDATMEEASAIVLALTRAYLGESGYWSTQKIFAQRGLLDCPRVTYPERLRAPLFVLPSKTTLRPAPLQLRFDAPATANTMILSFNAFPESPKSSSIEPGVLARSGAPITFSLRGTTVQSDASFQAFELEGAVSVPVTPGQPVFVSFVNTGHSTALFNQVRVTWSQDRVTTDGTHESTIPPWPNEFGSTDAQSEGCNCRSDQRPSSTWTLVFGLLALRRRRRA